MTHCNCSDWVRIGTLVSNNKELPYKEFDVFACRDCGALSINQGMLVQEKTSVVTETEDGVLVTQVTKCPSFCIAKVVNGVCLYEKTFHKCLYPNYRFEIDYEELIR